MAFNKLNKMIKMVIKSINDVHYLSDMNLNFEVKNKQKIYYYILQEQHFFFKNRLKIYKLKNKLKIRSNQ